MLCHYCRILVHGNFLLLAMYILYIFDQFLASVLRKQWVWNGVTPPPLWEFPPNLSVFLFSADVPVFFWTKSPEVIFWWPASCSQMCHKLPFRIQPMQSRANSKHNVESSFNVGSNSCGQYRRCGRVCSQLKVKKDFQFRRKVWEAGQRWYQTRGHCEHCGWSKGIPHWPYLPTNHTILAHYSSVPAAESHMQVWFGRRAPRALCVSNPHNTTRSPFTISTD